MNTEWAVLAPLFARLRSQWRRVRAHQDAPRDAGYTTEAIILIAILAALALVVGAIIVAKVTDKASNIPTS